MKAWQRSWLIHVVVLIQTPMPFDSKRMIFGGFEMLVEV